MNRQTLKFFFWIIVVYVAILLGTRSVTSESTPIVSVTAIPLIIIAIVIIRDLVSKSATSENQQSANVQGRGLVSIENPVDSIARQLNVTVRSSKSYFDDVVRSRLREIIIVKASLQTGIDIDHVRGILQNPSEGAKFLHDKGLYQLLYAEPPRDGQARIIMVDHIITRIENWKA